MSLQAVLAEVEPGWFVSADAASADARPLDPALLSRARVSALGERMLARWLASGPAAALLAPTPQREIGMTAVRWPRARLAPFVRDLGVLSMSPAIRAEVGRDVVRVLKQALGNSYLLALDRGVWDGRVPAESLAALISDLHAALALDSTAGDQRSHAGLYAMLDRRGRSELRAWAAESDAALGEWVALLHAPEPVSPTLLPAQQVQLLHEHHLARNREA